MPPTPAAPRVRRRWFRVGLRGLMGLVIGVSLPTAWVANAIHTRRAAVAAVRATHAQQAPAASP